jgi:hypothetical protein
LTYPYKFEVSTSLKHYFENFKIDKFLIRNVDVEPICQCGKFNVSNVEIQFWASKTMSEGASSIKMVFSG